MRIAFHVRGEVTEVSASEGQSVMRAAVGADIPGIVGECGGDMSCATCHVHVAPEWCDRLPRPSGDEEDLLEVVDDRTDCSRLSCQIAMSPDLDGLEVTVPQA